MPQPVVSSRYLFFRSPPKSVLVLKPACFPMSIKLTSSEAGLSSRLAGIAKPWVRGAAMPRICSNDTAMALQPSAWRRLRRVKRALWPLISVLQFRRINVVYTPPRGKMSSLLPSPRIIALYVVSCLVSASHLCYSQHAEASSSPDGLQLELRRPVRPWEFVNAVGQRAEVFGNETGTVEAWVYPVKLLRDFQLRFHLKDRVLQARDYAREVIVHPEGPSIVYATAGFTVRETLVTPPNATGAIIRLDIDAFESLQIEAQFVRDFQLMWPAALGGTYIEWDKKLNAFRIGHEQKVYAGMVGSPQTVAHTIEYFSNSGSSNLNSLSLEPVPGGQCTQFIFIAGSVNGPQGAAREYDHLAEDREHLQNAARKYYSDYLNKTVALKLPDAQLQAAYDWSRISLIQGLVDKPSLGRGLIARYLTAGDGSRPGFGWFFGRDSLWTDLAFDSIGDFATVRTALEFITKFQRADGKIEHEVPQTAELVPWFTD